MRSVLSAPMLLILSTTAVAQCDPVWDPALGTPGLGDGYAATALEWNGAQYAGGSFTSIGGTGTDYLARRDPGTGAWSSLGSGISGGFTNAFLTCLLSHDTPAGNRLIAGGFWASAGGQPLSASIAQWNGTSWSNMGAGWDGNNRGSIWALAAFGGELFAAGGFTTIGGVSAGSIASWDGSDWTARATTLAGSFSPTIFALAVFDDGSGEALYACGRFTGINGVTGTSCIARYNGSSWSSVGGGVFSSSVLFGPEAMTVFDDGSGPALYVAGYAFTPSGRTSTQVARWDGAWTTLGSPIGTGRLTAITSFDDGNGARLYIAGTAMPQINQIARRDGDQWQIVAGGCDGGAIPPSNFPSIFGLASLSDGLYAAGSFAQIGGQLANGLARLVACAPECPADFDGDGFVTGLDFDAYVAAFEAGDISADFDEDGFVTGLDFDAYVAVFEAGCE